MSPKFSNTWYSEIPLSELREEFRTLYQQYTELLERLDALNLSVGEDGELYYNGVQIS